MSKARLIAAVTCLAVVGWVQPVFACSIGGGLVDVYPLKDSTVSPTPVVSATFNHFDPEKLQPTLRNADGKDIALKTVRDYGYWNFARRYVAYRPHEALEQGEYTFELTADGSDNANREVRKTTTFTVVDESTLPAPEPPMELEANLEAEGEHLGDTCKTGTHRVGVRFHYPKKALESLESIEAAFYKRDADGSEPRDYALNKNLETYRSRGDPLYESGAIDESYYLDFEPACVTVTAYTHGRSTKASATTCKNRVFGDGPSLKWREDRRFDGCGCSHRTPRPRVPLGLGCLLLGQVMLRRSRCGPPG